MVVFRESKQNLFLHLQETSPPHVLHVEEGSALEKSGINMDDILYRVNGKQVRLLRLIDSIDGT